MVVTYKVKVTLNDSLEYSHVAYLSHIGSRWHFEINGCPSSAIRQKFISNFHYTTYLRYQLGRTPINFTGMITEQSHFKVVKYSHFMLNLRLL